MILFPVTHFPFKLSPFNWSWSSFFTIPSLYCNFLDSFSSWPACAICIDCICIDFCLSISCHFCTWAASADCPGWRLWCWWCGWELLAVLTCLLRDSRDRLRRSTASFKRTILLFSALKGRGGLLSSSVNLREGSGHSLVALFLLLEHHVEFVNLHLWPLQILLSSR